jgi:cell division protein ZapA
MDDNLRHERPASMGNLSVNSEKINKKSRVTVKIYDEEYVIKGSTDPATIEMLAAYVDKKMRLIGQKNQRLPLSKIAVLAALNIAEDMARLQDDYDSLVKQLEDMKFLENER